MTIIFFFPIVMSVIAAIMIAIGEYGWFTKGFFVLLTVTALVLQFVPPLHEEVHFLVPLSIQLVVCGCWYVMNQFEFL